MKRPFKYSIVCHKKKQVIFKTNQAPILMDLQTWEDIPGSNSKKLTQTKTTYIDTRYEAKLRLFNYIRSKYDHTKPLRGRLESI